MVAALAEVHTLPPNRPHTAFTAAEELTYVKGMMRLPPWFRAVMTVSTSGAGAISAMTQLASLSGMCTFCSGLARMAAVSAMKCTPQKTMCSALRSSMRRASSRESPRMSACLTTLSDW
jgi:hypothetical protein